MPPRTFFDLSLFDFDNILVDKEAIYKIAPHGPGFQQLDGICYCDADAGFIGGFRDVRDDEFWVPDHIPGRPIFPGVLMIETAAQLVSYHMMARYPERGFLGFGAADNIKFRGAIVPGQRILVLGQLLETRRRRCVGATQGVVDGKMVYEGLITGMWM